MAMTLVSTVTVGSGGAASIEFTNIPQTGKDLLLLISGRSTNDSVGANVFFVFNGSTATNYDTRWLYGTGSSVTSTSYTAEANLFFRHYPAAQSTASTFGNASLYISNYAGSTAKSASWDAVTENNATEAYQHIAAGRWGLTNAITSITLTTNANFAQHSTASLYLVS